MGLPIHFQSEVVFRVFLGLEAGTGGVGPAGLVGHGEGRHPLDQLLHSLVFFLEAFDFVPIR